MAIYAYADETIFTISPLEGKKALGCGILISPSEIKRDVIEEALNNLKADPEFVQRMDQKTVNRGFFHASEDSKNAHSHICRAIKNHVTCTFDFSFEDNVAKLDLNQLKFREIVLARCLSSSAIEFFNSAEEVFLTIEKRNGFTDTSSSVWLDAIYKVYEESTYGVPSFKTFFPKININLLGKSNPGLQVTDFLLWSVNRSKRDPEENTWMQRLKFHASHYFKDEKNHNRAHFHLNNVPRVKPDDKYPFKFQKTEEWPQLQNAYILIERFLVNLESGDFPSHAMHLYKDFEAISTLLKDVSYHLKSEDLEWVGRVFLRLFDTIPMYIDIKKEDFKGWTALFHAKYLASMLVRKNQMHFIRTQNAIHSWRFRMQTDRPDELKQLQFPFQQF